MFITFEGIDFCGKSTQAELLKHFFEGRKNKVEIIREPGGTEISEVVRSILLDKKHYHMVMETEIFLFSAARAQLVREKIRPYLNQGIYVISDRFHDSSTAYQGYGRGIPIQVIMNIHKLAIGDTLPDITFFIDIPVEVAHQRSIEKSSKNLDRMERSGDDFYNRVREGYLELANNESRFRVIDGMEDINIIYKKIINEIVKFEQR